MGLGMRGGFESQTQASLSGMARPSSDKRAIKEDIPGQSARLKQLRLSVGFETSLAFAKFLDISVTRYNAFENGEPLSRENAFRMVQKVPGLSLDWLYFGKADGLPLELARRLGVFGN